jgi:hypothetical protein
VECMWKLRFAKPFDLSCSSFSADDISVPDTGIQCVDFTLVSIGDLRWFYECGECGNAGCPSFESTGEVPPEIISHLSTHVDMNHPATN